MIVVDQVSKSYGQHKVLDQVSFSVKAGEIVSIIGSSGAGKTTLLNALIGAETVTGHISVDGIEISRLSRTSLQNYRRRIGIVFQDFKLIESKTVYENIAFALEVTGETQRFIEEKTVIALKKTGLFEFRNHFPREISGGQAQRTAIARALVHAPSLLFADEPTGNLDPENTAELATLLKQINENGTTILISTHDSHLVNVLKKRVIKLDNGRLISDKTNSTYN